MNRLKGLKVAILAANGFEQVEMEKPREALEAEGAETFLVSPEANQVQGWNHFEKGDEFSVDVPLSQANPESFDALLLPGGVINPDRLRTFPEAASFVKQMNEQHKPIAAICHGPWMLINGEVAKGHKLTSWSSIKQDLINAGAEWVDEPVVCDEQLVTSRKPDDIPKFNEAMIKLFESHARE
ncbi:type 1 glutamine amidotransferase domain-containing protein [Legionella jordanis]|uniref:Intracellular protease, ThiJ/PfpI family n=1 Tax=Legionella jordanis TaxID=456 RepID=A0A0W0VBS1_9GAMM|nr:type 1 glutamine amidotransferase domain-containing protein [Legionella jordanis]KTD17302.1 intracellular protease, ThiJ/PfpI family [Legionella jordanis]RMW99455.1 type 1 glutamine amidotransferase [Legionella jordanis]RMX15304.1 type 1 glutamine amidotransferase [Legionella jordanis]VEH12499.1 intracellular protease, ThiJ/PfpI family [Legionella jordanis]